MAQIEAVRVVQDAAYAASLSDQDWYALAQDPTWQEMVSEQSEMVAGVIAQYGNKLPGGGQNSAPAGPPVFRPFRATGPDIPRFQGSGIVPNTGPSPENLRMAGMLFMRTLRSRYPHAKITSIDTSEAEKIPGVRKILHRGNLPEEYKDVFLGSALPTRFLFNEEVFEVGAPIAVIAADSEHIGDVAIRAIKVAYEVLPAALDMLEAMKSSTPKQFTRTHRPEFRNEMKLGVNRDGTISFGIFKVIANVGAQRAGAANGAWVNMQNLYKIPNLRLEAVEDR